MYDMHVRRRFQTLDERDNSCSRDPERGRQKSREFHEYIIRGYELAAPSSSVAVNTRRPVMEFLAGIHDMTPSRSIGENIRHRV